jgi:uncharacterized protein (DUF433 family)
VEAPREHVEIVEGAGGPKARIKGSRIRVEDVVVWHERQRMTPFEIVHEYPTITIADVYAALAYYWDNRGEIESRLADAEREYRRGIAEQGDIFDRLGDKLPARPSA